MYQPSLPKAHFMLGGMYVNIHLLGVGVEIEHVGGLALISEFFLVSLTDRMVYQAVSHPAPVHEEVLDIARTLGKAHACYPAHEPQPASLELDAKRLFGKPCTTHLGDPLPALISGTGWRQKPCRATLVMDSKGSLKPAQGNAVRHLCQVPLFRLLGA